MVHHQIHADGDEVAIGISLSFGPMPWALSPQMSARGQLRFPVRERLTQKEPQLTRIEWFAHDRRRSQLANAPLEPRLRRSCDDEDRKTARLRVLLESIERR